MIRRVQGSFRVNTPLVGTPNMTDTWPSSGPRSAGDTLIDLPSLQQPVNEAWKIVAASITGALSLEPVAPPIYGRFGMLNGAVVYPATATAGNGGEASARGFQPYPYDTTMMFSLWDPSVDELPPFTFASAVAAGGPILPFQGSLQLPTPLDLPGGGPEFGIGMWLTPSLLGPSYTNGILQVFQARYTIYIDDGTGPEPLF
jgi:hypothetical protein